MTKLSIFVAAALAAAIGAVALAADAIPELKPYPLTADVQSSIAEFAGECDVMILGETHGTREVPAIVETLLDPLTKLGYRAIALEVPHDEQPAIEAWATGTTGAIPTFFAVPGADGRGNREVLAMVRRALRPPYEWKLICFDETETEMQRQMMERLPKDVKGTIAERAAKLSSDDIVAISLQRDASMAINLAAGRRKLAARGQGPRDLRQPPRPHGKPHAAGEPAGGTLAVVRGEVYARTSRNRACGSVNVAGVWRRVFQRRQGESIYAAATGARKISADAGPRLGRGAQSSDRRRWRRSSVRPTAENESNSKMGAERDAAA